MSYFLDRGYLDSAYYCNFRPNQSPHLAPRQWWKYAILSIVFDIRRKKWAIRRQEMLISNEEVYLELESGYQATVSQEIQDKVDDEISLLRLEIEELKKENIDLKAYLEQKPTKRRSKKYRNSKTFKNALGSFDSNDIDNSISLSITGDESSLNGFPSLTIQVSNLDQDVPSDSKESPTSKSIKSPRIAPQEPTPKQDVPKSNEGKLLSLKSSEKTPTSPPKRIYVIKPKDSIRKTKFLHSPKEKKEPPENKNQAIIPMISTLSHQERKTLLINAYIPKQEPQPHLPTNQHPNPSPNVKNRVIATFEQETLDLEEDIVDPETLYTDCIDETNGSKIQNPDSITLPTISEELSQSEKIAIQILKRVRNQEGKRPGVKRKDPKKPFTYTEIKLLKR